MKIEDFLTVKFGIMLVVHVAVLLLFGMPGGFGLVVAWIIALFGSKFYSQFEKKQLEKNIETKMLNQKGDNGKTLTYTVEGKPWILKEEIKNNGISATQ